MTLLIAQTIVIARTRYLVLYEEYKLQACETNRSGNWLKVEGRQSTM